MDPIITAEKKRWSSYRKINTSMPDARIFELDRILSLVDPKPNEKILEAGSGSGYLTKHLVGKKSPYASVITSDISPEGLQELEVKNKKWGLPITTLLISKDYLVKKKYPDLYSNYFDKVVSLATFHHFDNRDLDTGIQGRVNLLFEIFDMLKKGGTLSIADVAHGTRTQQYFDYNDDPIYFHPNGHPHDFMCPEKLEDVLADIGFKDISISIENVPWEFVSEESAMYFIHSLHNAQCSQDESFARAKKILGFGQREDGRYELGWQLFFMTAKK